MKLTLKQARVGMGLTQKEMAERLGVSVVTYRKYEETTRKMKLDTLIRFSKVTGIDLLDLKL